MFPVPTCYRSMPAKAEKIRRGSSAWSDTRASPCAKARPASSPERPVPVRHILCGCVRFDKPGSMRRLVLMEACWTGATGTFHRFGSQTGGYDREVPACAAGCAVPGSGSAASPVWRCPTCSRKHGAAGASGWPARSSFRGATAVRKAWRPIQRLGRCLSRAQRRCQA